MGHLWRWHRSSLKHLLSFAELVYLNRLSEPLITYGIDWHCLSHNRPCEEVIAGQFTPWRSTAWGAEEPLRFESFHTSRLYRGD